MVNDTSSERVVSAPEVVSAAEGVTMNGPVTWTLLVFIVGIVIAVAGGVAVTVWKVLAYFAKQREELQKHTDLRLAAIDKAIDAIREANAAKLEAFKEATDRRLAALETHKAELALLLKQMEQNQARTEAQFQVMREELHDRFRAMDDRFAQMIRGVKYVMPDPSA